MDVIKGNKELTAVPPEIYCNQTAMGLPPVTCSIPHSKVILVKQDILEEYLKYLNYQFGYEA
jgi:hypothetical protein